MAKPPVTPSIKAHSFSCPRCGAYANQKWYGAKAVPLPAGELPFIVTETILDKLKNAKTDHEEELRNYLLRASTRNIFFEPLSTSVPTKINIVNFYISRCFSCQELSLWHADRLIFPILVSEIEPSADLPADIAQDFREAGGIVNLSPRGAAALARLCIQKLCIHLGEKGKYLNDDIASLVKKGLDPRVQQALDVVRVIGNNAVHPGEIDVRDDVEMATRLLMIVNQIATDMITRPRELAALYGSLPETVLAQIEQRDRAKTPAVKKDGPKPSGG